jgi:hypothetical protein
MEIIGQNGNEGEHYNEIVSDEEQLILDRLGELGSTSYDTTKHEEPLREQLKKIKKQ